MKYEEIMESPAYGDLNCVARCLLDEFQRIFRPARNGKLSVSVKAAQRRLNIAQNTAMNAFTALSEHGFIKLTSGASYQSGKTREWLLTTGQCGDKPPTDDWKRWEPGKPVFRISNNLRPQYVVRTPSICGTQPLQNVVRPDPKDDFIRAALQ